MLKYFEVCCILKWQYFELMNSLVPIVVQKFELRDQWHFDNCILGCCRRDFVHFAEICFKSFGDRVKYWITINEPTLVADNAFIKGIYSSGHCSLPFGNCYTGNSDVEPLLVMHNMLLSHAKAVELYRNHYQVTKLDLNWRHFLSHFLG